MSVVQITSPSAVLVTIGGEGTVTWSSQYDQYQTHYEIQYKLKDSESWSTLGKLASNQKSANLQDIYNTLPKGFSEFYYRIAIWYKVYEYSEDMVDIVGSLTGYEVSNAYQLVFRDSLSSANLIDEAGDIYPCYNTITDTEIDCVVIPINGKDLKIPIVEKNHAMRGNLPFPQKNFNYYHIPEYGKGESYFWKEYIGEYTYWDKHTTIVGYYAEDCGGNIYRHMPRYEYQFYKVVEYGICTTYYYSQYL